MTVKELIESLRSFPGDAIIYLGSQGELEIVSSCGEAVLLEGDEISLQTVDPRTIDSCDVICEECGLGHATALHSALGEQARPNIMED